MSEQSAASSTLPTGGTARPIVRWGEPVMHRTQEPITVFDEELRALAADMVATMYAADGVGLAACQIGVDRSVFVFDCPDDDGVRHVGVVCNPELFLPEGRDRRLDDGEEGCLSLPGLAYDTRRALSVVAKGFNQHGDPVVIDGSELLARCIQHETDHLDGILFNDRLDREQRKLALKAVREAQWAGESAPPVRLSPHNTFGRAL